MKLPPIFTPQRRIKFFWLSINGTLQATMAISFSILVKNMFDHHLQNNDLPFLFWKSALPFIAISLITAWLKYKERSDAEALGQDYVNELRNRMFSRLCRTELRQLDYHGRGDIILRFASDLSAIRQWISLGLARILVAGITLIMAITALCFINLTLALIVGSVLFINALLSSFLGYRLQQSFREARRSRSYLANNLTEKISSITTVKASGQRRREKKRIKQQSMRLVVAMVERAKAIGMHRAVTEGSLLIATSLVLLVGVLLSKNNEGSISPGTVVAAMTIVALLTQPLRNIGRVYEYWHGANIAYEKLGRFLITTGSSRRERPEKTGPGIMTLKKLKDFNGESQPNLTIKPGRKIVILGKNGAGKSSLLAQLSGLMSPTAGEVRLDNFNVTKLHESFLRNVIGMVSPELPLLKGSIRKNICYRWPAAPDAEIQRVVESCGLTSILEKLPKGIDSRVAERGNNLSLGEQQRICLARALLGSPQVLLLDEADSFLDGESRELFTTIIRNYTGTIIMATHNVDHILLADDIWLIKDGGICWSGPRDDFSITSLGRSFEDSFNSIKGEING
ncbi:MAG: ABC transporter ATP-binding protein [Methylophaga sp.]|nr:ABC transporter ATP-binding protein [Methylophaga sp.]